MNLLLRAEGDRVVGYVLEPLRTACVMGTADVISVDDLGFATLHIDGDPPGRVEQVCLAHCRKIGEPASPMDPISLGEG